ncbi:MAG TPA: hypothetical protein VJR30_14135, partial [Bradyrhizobium sp.]|nr:hypothetical protein [Bradyrhizobium sp.]
LRAIIDGDERAAAARATEHVMRAGAHFLSSVYVPDENASLEPSTASVRARPGVRGARSGARPRVRGS